MGTRMLKAELAERSAAKKVLVVVGTGVSLASTDGEKLASWKGLIANGVERCVDLDLRDDTWAAAQKKLLEAGDLDDLLGVAEQVSRRLGWKPEDPCGGKWSGWLRNTVGSLRAKHPELIEAIRDLGAPIATLNYDNLLTDVIGIRPITWQRAERWIQVLQGEDQAILHLHGHWDHPSSVVLGIRSYDAVLGQGLAQHLERALVSWLSLAFIGCSGTLEDPNFSSLLTWMREQLSGAEHSHYLLIQENEPLPVDRSLLDEMRVAPLYYGKAHADLLPFIRDLAPKPPNKSSGASSTRGAPTSGIATHNLPFFPREFIGRDNDLNRLRTMMLSRDTESEIEWPWVAVTGMPGIGKTQLAMRYAWTEAKTYETICWVNAAGEDISARVAALASEPLKLGLQSEASDTDKLSAVQRRLRDGGPHLLVFDNVDHPDSFLKFVPPGAAVSVLITSSREDFHLQSVRRLPLSFLPEAEAIALLRGTAKWSPEEDQAARDLGEAFGWLTLPLAVAGRVMQSPSWWPSKLLDRVQRQGGPVPWLSGNLPPDYLIGKGHNLAQLFEASMDLLEIEKPTDQLAKRILLASSWLAPVPIPLMLFQELSILPGKTEPDYIILEDALDRLVDIGLATMEQQQLAIAVHRLIGEYARQKGGEKFHQLALDIMARAVKDLAPNVFIAPGPGLGGLSLAPLESHLATAFASTQSELVNDQAWIPIRFAEILDARGRTSEAIGILGEAATRARAEDWRARFLGMKGRLLNDLGRYEEARDVLDLAYRTLQEMLELCDQDVLAAGIALGEALAGMKQHQAALELLEHLSDDCADLKRPFPNGALVRRTMARVLAEIGRFEDALVQFAKALSIETTAPAISYHIQEPAGSAFIDLFAKRALAGETAELQRVLSRVQDFLGKNPHPTIVAAHHEAGWRLMQANRFNEALGYLEFAMIGCTRLYPPDSIDSGATHRLLGWTLMEVGRQAESVGHLEKALSIARTRFEPGDERIEDTQRLLDAAKSAALPRA